MFDWMLPTYMRSWSSSEVANLVKGKLVLVYPASATASSFVLLFIIYLLVLLPRAHPFAILFRPQSCCLFGLVGVSGMVA